MNPTMFLLLTCFIGIGAFLLFYFNTENLLRRKFRRKNYKSYFLLAIAVFMLPVGYFLLTKTSIFSILMVAAGALPLLYLLIFETLRMLLFSGSTPPVLISSFKGFSGRLHDGYKPTWKERFFSLAIFILPLLIFFIALVTEMLL